MPPVMAIRTVLNMYLLGSYYKHMKHHENDDMIIIGGFPTPAEPKEIQKTTEVKLQNYLGSKKEKELNSVIVATLQQGLSFFEVETKEVLFTTVKSNVTEEPNEVFGEHFLASLVLLTQNPKLFCKNSKVKNL